MGFQHQTTSHKTPYYVPTRKCVKVFPFSHSKAFQRHVKQPLNRYYTLVTLQTNPDVSMMTALAMDLHKVSQGQSKITTFVFDCPPGYVNNTTLKQHLCNTTVRSDQHLIVLGESVLTAQLPTLFHSLSDEDITTAFDKITIYCEDDFPFEIG